MKKIVWGLLSLLPLATYAQTTFRKYLSGTDKDHTVQWDFFCTTGRNSGHWTKIAVPSNWELQGFGAYNYGHDKVKADETGIYRREFQTEPAWQHKKIFLVFEGSMTDTKVSINGQLAGPIHQGAFYRFKYDITPLLKPTGSNQLEITVNKMSADPSVNRAERNGDFWLYGGIYRPVYLEIVPETFIDRLAIDAKAGGSIKLDVYTQNMLTGETITAQVEKLDGTPVGNPFSANYTNSQDTFSLSGKNDHPLTWTPESPNLYQLKVTIKNHNSIIHEVKQRFGFRTIELRLHDGLYVNDKKVILKGCNRHSFWPETGRTLSHGIQLKDVRLMKEMNMNAVRMSHYPPDQDFLDVCDSLGLFVLDELTGWQASYDTAVGRRLVKELVTRDVNHPSIIFWDNGNEGGWNRALDGDYALYDPQQRVVIHPWERINGTNTKHYPDYNYMSRSVTDEKDVFFPTEFMHGLYDGGAGAALDDFWNAILRHPHGAGGFIWAFLDEAVRRTDKHDSLDADGNHAPDGIVGPYREKEASFYTIKEIWSPVYIDTQNTTLDKIRIEDRYAFTNLKQCRFKWQLVKFPTPRQQQTKSTILASGIAPSPDLEPGAMGFLNLDLPKPTLPGDALYLTAYAPDGKEIYTWSWATPNPTPNPVSSPNPAPTSSSNPTPNPVSSPNPAPTSSPTPAPTSSSTPTPTSSSTPALTARTSLAPHTALSITEDSTTLTINCGGIKYRFDKNTGYLAKVLKPSATISLSGGPSLAGVDTRLKSFTHNGGNGQYSVEADYEGTDAALHIKWTFTPAHLPQLDYSYTQKGDIDFMGISFRYPEEKITGMKWKGRGPYRVWQNRLKGQKLGIWHKAYNNSITGETWGYPEFKGYHAEVGWVVLENKESPFTIYTDNKNIYLQMLHPGREKAALSNNNVEPPFPEGEISFLKAISAIGTKFQAAKTMGPQSQKFHADGAPVNGTLWFDFK